jgi:hypothetical protein
MSIHCSLLSTLAMIAVPVLATPLAAQADDHCAGATVVTLGTNGPFTNVGYTTSAPAWPCGSGGIDRWFAFTATFTGQHTFQTCSPTLTYDSTIQVFSGTCAALQSLNCNDDSCGLGSALQVNLTAGSTYLVRVGGFGGDVGNFDLVVTLGNGTGSIALATPSGCGNATLTFQGTPAIGATCTANLGNLAGTPFVGLGLTNPQQLFCGCVLGSDWGAIFPGASLPMQVPADPSFINVQFFVQGADFGAAGGCGAAPFTLTDSFRVTIG